MEGRELPLPLKKKINKSHPDEQEWERQTTKPIAYNFGMLFNDGKKNAYLRNGFKILLVIVMSFYKNVRSNNMLTVVVALPSTFLDLQLTTVSLDLLLSIV